MCSADFKLCNHRARNPDCPARQSGFPHRVIRISAPGNPDYTISAPGNLDSDSPNGLPTGLLTRTNARNHRESPGRHHRPPALYGSTGALNISHATRAPRIVPARGGGLPMHLAWRVPTSSSEGQTHPPASGGFPCTSRGVCAPRAQRGKRTPPAGPSATD